MEIVILVVGVALLAAFFWWPKVSKKIDDIQEDITEAHEKVEDKLEEIADDIEEAVEDALDKLPSEAELKKLTKAKLDELAEGLGIKLDRRKTKAKMIEDLKASTKK